MIKKLMFLSALSLFSQLLPAMTINDDSGTPLAPLEILQRQGTIGYYNAKEKLILINRIRYHLETAPRHFSLSKGQLVSFTAERDQADKYPRITRIWLSPAKQ